MAEYKLYNLKDPKTGQEEPQISSKEEFDAIKQKVPTSNIKNPRTGQEGSAESVVKEGDMNPGDGRNVAIEIAKCLRDALREHGDEMKAVFLSNTTNEGATIKIQYMPDEQGQADEDEFVFRWGDGTLRLDNVANPVELCQLQKQSGTVNIQKDLVKANLLKFLQSHDGVSDSEPADPNALPDGQPVDEKIGGVSQSGDGNSAYEGVDDAQSYKTDSDGHLWESEECQQAFCDAVDMYRKAKDKESIKNLFRAARPYQKGNTIQEKLKGAVDWYNIYTQKPPKNTKEQVFLEDEVDKNDLMREVFEEVFKPLFEAINALGHYIHGYKQEIFGQDPTVRDLYQKLYHTATALSTHCLKHTTSDLEEFMDLNDPIANGEPDNYGGFGRDNDEFNSNHEEWDDEPVVHEGDEWGPEVGDDVDYEGGHYRLYGYCGYEVVLQNVDDERDFKVVKPENVGIKAPQKDLKETNWVDPDELPDNETQRI